jgi:histidine kinase family protein
MPGPSIRRPLAVTLLAGVVTVAMVAAAVIGHLYEHATEAAAADTLRGAHGMFRAMERGDVKKMDAALGALLEDEELRRLFLARDRQGLLAAALPRFQDLKARDGITHWYFIGPDRRVILRVHKPALFGDQVDRLTLAKAAETHDMGAGLELGRTAFALRVVRAWMVDGKLVGYLELAEEIDHFLVRLKQETGNELGVLVKKEFLDEAAWAAVTGKARNTWNARPDVVVVDTTSFSDGVADIPGDLSRLPDGGLLLDEEVRGGQAWLRGYFPILDAAGRKVGALAVLHDFSRMHQIMTAGRRQVLLVVLGMSLLACLVVWLALERWVLGPLGVLAEEAERAAGAGPAPPGIDELQRLRRALRRRTGEAP